MIKLEQTQLDSVISAINSRAKILNPTFVGLHETKVSMITDNIDLLAGNLFTQTVSADKTLSISGVQSSPATNSFIYEVTNGGSAIITWFSGIKWASGIAPVLTTAGVDILGFYSHDGGTTWRGLVLAKDSK